MTYNLRHSLLVGFLAASATLIGCGDGASTTSTPGAGGSSAAGAGGSSAGGSSSGGSSSGGTNSGGNSAGTNAGGTDAGGTDAGGTDAGGTDAGGTDAGGTDAGGTDAGGTDAGGTDAGGTDAGGTDAGGTDAGGTDAGGTDAGGTDAGGTDAGGTDAGGTDAGGTDAGGTDAGGTDAGGTDAGGSDAGGSDAGGSDAGGSGGSSAGSSSGGSSSGGSSAGGSSSGGSGGAGGSGALTCADAYSESDCGICGEKSCCKEMDACLGDANCLACLQGDDTKCNGNALNALNNCLDTKCKNECVGVCNDGGTNYAAPDACNKCQDAEFNANGCCANEAAACGANQDCVDLNTCLGGCTAGNQGCIDTCANKFPNGIDDFNGIIACTYGDGATTPGACGTVCSDPNSASCNDGGTEYGAANATNCGACQDAELAASGCCETSGNACGANAACVALIQCVNNCADNACVQACGDKNPNGINDFNDFVGCLFGPADGEVGSCGTVCNY